MWIFTQAPVSISEMAEFNIGWVAVKVSDTGVLAAAFIFFVGEFVTVLVSAGFLRAIFGSQIVVHCHGSSTQHVTQLQHEA